MEIKLKEMVISAELMDRLLDYISKRPCAEVFDLAQDLLITKQKAMKLEEEKNKIAPPVEEDKKD